MQATKSQLGELADALRDIVMTARRQASESAHDTAVIGLLAHLVATGPLRASELAERAWLDPSTVSRHLRSLETDGFLVRTPDPDDGRATRLEVTSAGRDLVRDARQQKLARLGMAVADWSADDLATLTRLTRRLADSMEAL